ncbi:MAG TPA: DUF2065 domain-containing protein [Steroidobacteraceae bacterium]
MLQFADLMAAIALVFVIEGLILFANPAALKRMMEALLQLGDREVRIGGFASMLFGLMLLFLVR